MLVFAKDLNIFRLLFVAREQVRISNWKLKCETETVKYEHT